MADNPSDRRRDMAPQARSLPEAAWAKQAIEIRGPFSGFAFAIRAAANMKAMQVAMQHARVYGQLMDVAAETMGKIHKAQDAAREYAVRQELAGELYDNEIERHREKAKEDRHQRALAAKRRAQELIKADNEILLARQTLRAKKKFEPLKHAIGEERFKTEAARRKVGAAEARMAAAEASESQAARPGNTASEGESAAPSRAAMVSSLLDGVRAQLQEMRADDEDSDQRQQLVADEAALERILAGLLKRGKN